MYELLYTSVSPVRLSDSELIQILQHARTKNKRLGVTGMLVYYQQEIMQILEGEKDVVKDLYQTISLDPRHMSVEVFYQGEIKQRAFANWSMGFKVLDEESIQKITANFEYFDKSKNPISLIKERPNRGKETFLELRKKL